MTDPTKGPLTRENLAERLKTTPLFVVTDTPRHPLLGDHRYAFGDPAEEILEYWPEVPRRRQKSDLPPLFWKRLFQKIGRAILRHR